MKAGTCFGLIRGRDLAALAGVFLLSCLIALATAAHQRMSGIPADVTVLLLFPPFGFGLILGGWMARPMRLHPMLLLPGLPTALQQWHCGLSVILALVWAVIIKWTEPTFPLVCAVGISTFASTFALHFTFRFSQRASSPFRFLLWLIIGVGVGANVSKVPRLVVMDYPWIAGTAGFILAALNVRLGFDQKRLKALARIRDTSKPSEAVSSQRKSGRPRPILRLLNGLLNGNWGGKWNYRTRGDSLMRWGRVAFDELHPSVLSTVYMGVLIVVGQSLPWWPFRSEHDALAWYRTVHAPLRFWDSPGLIMFLYGMGAVGVLAGRVRPGHLYPISRQRRATVMIAGTAATYCVLLVLGAGTPVLAGTFIGIWNGLPLHPEHALAFTIRIAMVIPIMPIARWGGFRAELQGDFVTFGGCLLLAGILGITGQNLVLDWGLKTGVVICLASIAVSQLTFYFALRHFYSRSDLLCRGGIEPMARSHLVADDTT